MNNAVYGRFEPIETIGEAQFEALRVGQTVLGRVVATLLREDNGWINAQNVEVGGGYII